MYLHESHLYTALFTSLHVILNIKMSRMCNMSIQYAISKLINKLIKTYQDMLISYKIEELFNENYPMEETKDHCVADGINVIQLKKHYL